MKSFFSVASSATACAIAGVILPLVVHAQRSRANPRTELSAEVTFSTVSTAQSSLPFMVQICGDRPSPESAKAEQRGVALVSRAMNSEPPDARMLVQALQAFDQQCGLHDDLALERRAAPLYLLGRYVEAARSLDAFLAAHPLDSLHGDVRARVEANQDMYTQQVASIRFESNVPSAAIAINDAPKFALDGRVLRCPPGVIAFEVSAPGYATIRRSVNVAAGEISNLRIDLTTQENDEVPPPVTLGLASDTPQRPAGSSNLGPIALLSAGGALVLVGVAGSWMRLDRAAEYKQAGCSSEPTLAGCSDVDAEHGTAKLFQAGGFALGGLLVTGGLVWLLSRDGGDSKAKASLDCSPVLGEAAALLCQGRF